MKIPTGYSNFFEADDEDQAIAKAIADLEARGKIPFEIPLYVEDLGDGEYEVVLRERIAERPAAPISGTDLANWSAMAGLPIDQLPRQR